MKKVIMTGATGFIGANLVEAMINRGIEVHAVVRPNSKGLKRIEDFSGVKIIEGDISNLKPEYFERGYEAFYHLAWEGTTGKDRSDYRIQSKNALLCLEMAELAKRIECTKIIYTGTIYENLCDSILSGDKFRTPSFYLLSKKYAYGIVSQLTKKIGIDFVWCNFFHPIGKYMSTEQMAAYAAYSLMKNIKPSFSEAKEPYDIIYVNDLAEGLILAGEKKLLKDKYYIGSTKPRLLREYLEEMKKIINPSVALGIGERPDDGLRFDFEWLDCSDFQKETGYNPKTNFFEMVQSLLQWLEGFVN